MNRKVETKLEYITKIITALASLVAAIATLVAALK